MKTFLLIALMICPWNVFAGEDPQSVVKNLLESFIDTLQRIQTAVYTIENIERIEGTYLSGLQHITYQKSPFQCKVEFVNPNAGSQMVFNEFDEKAVYSPVGFPYFDLSLDPLGSLMRRNNHHTVYEVGFEYLIGIIQSALNNKNNVFDLVKETDKQFVVKVMNTDFEYQNYQVRKEEDIRTIAVDKKINEYLVLERNEDVDFYDDVTLGDVISIPNSYAKEVRLVIHKESYLPQDIFVYDDLGLFEEYHYSEIKTNMAHVNLELDN